MSCGRRQDTVIGFLLAGVGHRDAMVRAVAAVERAWPGVTLAGNHLHGINVNDAMRSGVVAVERLGTGVQTAPATAAGHTGEP